MTFNLASGVNKLLIIGEESTENIESSQPGTILRRTTSTFTVSNSPIASDEILPSQQDQDWHLGTTAIQGTLNGLLSVGSYNNIFEGALRARLMPGVYVTASDLQLYAPGNFLVASTVTTDLVAAGLRTGDIVWLGGLTGAAEPNSYLNFRVTSVARSALGLYCPTAVPFPGIQPVNILVVGHKVSLSASGQIPLSYTFEEWFSDVSISQLSVGCVLNTLSINVPPSGFCSFSANFVGGEMVISNNRFFSGASGQTRSVPVMASTGVLMIGGIQQAIVTSFSLQISADVVSDDVELSYNAPRIISTNKITVTGSMTIMLGTGDGFMPAFLNEEIFQIAVLMTDSQESQPGFISLFLPAVKLSRVGWQDGTTAITRNFNFQALQQTTDPTTDSSALIIQQSS